MNIYLNQKLNYKMGIKGLNPIIRKYAPDVIKEIHISQLAFKKVAIDTSLFLFKYKAIFGDKWISCFINLVSCLRKNDVHCVFVFDGESPIEKQKEKEQRRSARDKIEEKYKILQDKLELFKQTGEISQELLDVQEKYAITTQTRLLGGTNKKINVTTIEEHIEKLKSQVISMSKNDIILIKKFLDIMSVPYIQSKTEGETLCSYMCKWGLVDAVMTDDTDVLAYGTPIFISDMNSVSGMCKVIGHEELMEVLEMTEETFRDFCIMCGTDYNTNIKKVGQETAYKLIKEFLSIDALPEKYDVSILNHIRVRELFRVPERDESIVFGYCGIPDKEEFSKFVFENNLRLDVQGIFNNFYRQISFDD
jgi:5'-3' exonuclease